MEGAHTPTHTLSLSLSPHIMIARSNRFKIRGKAVGWTKLERYNSSSLSHVSPITGKFRMVDITTKAQKTREAIARGKVFVGDIGLRALEENLKGDDGSNLKGNVLFVAELAGIQGAKLTSQLIPLCHQVNLSSVQVQCRLVSDQSEDLMEQSTVGTSPFRPFVSVEASAKCVGQTGVEMEALVAVSTTCLTVYDMLKAAYKGRAQRICSGGVELSTSMHPNDLEIGCIKLIRKTKA